MIGLNQFRYGNLFTRKKSKQIIKFQGLAPLSKNLYFTNDNNQIIDYCLLEIDGISIDEKWLIKFGFQVYDRMGDNVFFIHPLYERIRLEICIWEDSKIDINIYNSKSSKLKKCQEIKHIHQLQNFVFGLTFSELIINENKEV